MKSQTHSLFTDFDIELFKAGKHYRLYEKFGAHQVEVNDQKGMYFSVWAPSAKHVSVVGDFNYWNPEQHPLYVRWDSSGIWEAFIPNVVEGVRYKYRIVSHNKDYVTEKADPFGFFSEHPPCTASITWENKYKWKDTKWMKNRAENNRLDRPFSIYEVHLPSWKRNVEENRPLSYTELATELVNYVKEMNFTHVEFMPIMEYPYDPSWGYQITGYFAPTSRMGNPQELMHLIDSLHKEDIGVILDWVPSHFPSDKHGLGLFDGTHLYEHPDPKKGYHPDWKSLIFNYERNEIRAFLISNTFYWLDKFHIDGIRVDAVASIIYLDYSREEGEWEPNINGGNENLEAISFLQEFNQAIYKEYPDIQTIAEESTSYPMVTKPVYLGGLGFGMKWMMGWMHDTLEFFSKDTIYRNHHLNEITFSIYYAFSENFLLPLSHDEVVHGKGSIISRIHGDQWQKFANLKVLYGLMYMHPGTKLLFMGNEIGQYDEWNFKESIQWDLLKYPCHNDLRKCIASLNNLYKNEPALYEKQFSQEGFEWITHDDRVNSVISFIRKGHDNENNLIILCNFTPIIRENYKIGLEREGELEEIFNSDWDSLGGSNVVNGNKIETKKEAWNQKQHHISVTLPPLAIVVFKYIK